jgi:signal peptide peptidase SppA
MSQIATEHAGPIPPKSTEIVDEPWDGPAEEAAIDNNNGRAVLRRMYAWVDSDRNPDTKAAYKFPHHKVTNGEPGSANVNGVRQALSRVPQANIPEADRAGVREHLQRHLDDFDNQKQSGSSKGSYPHLVRALSERSWAVMEETFMAIRNLVAMRVQGVELSDDERRQRIEATSYSSRPRGGAYPVQEAGASQIVAVLPLYGVIVPKASLFSDVSGASSVEGFRRMFNEALNNTDVSAIVIDVDSPGGQTDLVAELAAEIRDARGVKPIVANANTLCCSAAYWIACQADQLYATMTAKVGSIGVYCVHEDYSGAFAQEGITPTIISAGKHKTDGNMYEPLAKDAESDLQARIDATYDLFVADVAAGRGIPEDQVRNGYGEGRWLDPKAALAEGMIEGIETLDATIRRVAQQAAQSGGFQSKGLAGTDPAVTAAPAGGLSFADVAENARVAVEALGARVDSLAEFKRGQLTGSKRTQLNAVVAGCAALVERLEATDPEKRQGENALTLEDEWQLANALLV